MTDYIKQMMKTAGIPIRKIKPFYCVKNQENIPCELCIEKYGMCLSQREIYPDFTAEKQLKLINLIRLNDCDITIYTRPNNHIAISTQPHAFKLSYNASAFKFEEALAQLTTQLMNAGELDKEKVREYLWTKKK